MDAKSLKIACTFPEMADPKKVAIMEVFVFLQALNVADEANTEWQYRKLFDYSDEQKAEKALKKAKEQELAE